MEKCFCCGLITAAFIAGLISAIVYGAACALEVWVIASLTQGDAPVVVYILMVLFFLVFVCAVIFCVGLVRKKIGHAWIWLLPVCIVWPIDIALIIYLVVVHYTVGTNLGLAELIFMICRKFIDILCIAAVALLYSNYRKMRRDQLASNLLVAESMSFKGSTLDARLKGDTGSMASRQRVTRERELQNMVLTNDPSRPYPSFRLKETQRTNSFTALDYMRAQADGGAATDGYATSRSAEGGVLSTDMVGVTVGDRERRESGSSGSSKGRGKKLPGTESATLQVTRVTDNIDGIHSSVIAPQEPPVDMARVHESHVQQQVAAPAVVAVAAAAARHPDVLATSSRRSSSLPRDRDESFTQPSPRVHPVQYSASSVSASSPNTSQLVQGGDLPVASYVVGVTEPSTMPSSPDGQPAQIVVPAGSVLSPTVASYTGPEPQDTHISMSIFGGPHPTVSRVTSSREGPSVNSTMERAGGSYLPPYQTMEREVGTPQFTTMERDLPSSGSIMMPVNSTAMNVPAGQTGATAVSMTIHPQDGVAETSQWNTGTSHADDVPL